MLNSSKARADYVKTATRAKPELRAGVGAFMGTVYAWMAAGLALSALVAYQCSQSVEFMEAFNGGSLGWALLTLPFLLIFLQPSPEGRGAWIKGTVWYLLLTGMMGTWMTGVAFQATQSAAYGSAVLEALGVTVGMFAGMSLTGWVTRKDLSGLGYFLIAGLWGLVAVGVLNIFVLQSASVHIWYHVGAVVIFAGLTAYDTQHIKGIYLKHGGSHGLAVWGAFQLYLDFINIFLSLLSLMGGSSSSD